MPDTRKPSGSDHRQTPARNDSEGPIDPSRPTPRDDRARSAQHGESDRPAKQRNARRPKGEAGDDSPLESIGKAVSAPVRGAADEDADEKPG